MGMTICALGDAAAMPVQSFLKKFKPEFLRHVEERRCPFGDHGWGLEQSSREALVGGGEVLGDERHGRAGRCSGSSRSRWWSPRSACWSSRNPVYAAMNLVAAFFFMAGIYVLLVAHLIAFMQILVYAGAVMVLFLFVIMLLSLGDEAPRQGAAPGDAGASARSGR